MVKPYIKKPVEIQAVQYTGDNRKDVGNSLEQCVDDNSLIIETLEGEMKASLYDYVIRGVKGEYYPCKPDIFEETYDVVEEDIE